MIVLALDTTTRAGSLAVVRDGTVLGVATGDATRGHAERLPDAITRLLADHGLELPQVDLFGVAAGPGSFTGLRIGIATVQGLAFALGRPVAGISVLDALAVVARGETADRAGAQAARKTAASSGDRSDAGAASQPPPLVAAWMDAQRNEVFAELYRNDDTLVAIDGPTSEPPARVLDRWHAIAAGARIRIAGDALSRYRHLLVERLGSGVEAVEPLPPLAPIIATLAASEAAAGRAGSPHAVRPIYVRRPDAELARDRVPGVKS